MAAFKKYRKFLEGIGIIPKSSSASSELGEFEVLSTDSKAYFHNGTINDPIVQETVTATLTNKTINGPDNTITNLNNGNLDGTAGITNANLAVMADQTIKGNVSGGVAVPSDLTASEVVTMTGAITDLTGDVTATGPGSASATLENIGAGVSTTLGSDATGDIYYRNSGGDLDRLGIGSTNDFLKVTAGLPSWSPISALTLTDTHIFVGNAGNVATDVAMSGDATIANTGAVTLADTAVTPGSYTKTNLTVDSKGRITAAANGAITVPTIQKFLTGSGTYTTPAGISYIKVKMVGGGGGGRGSGTASLGSGGNGGDTTFGTTFLNAGGGVGGTPSAGAGGTSSIGAGADGIALSGGMGGAVSLEGTANTNVSAGGQGGSSAFGGAGAGGAANGAGQNASANTGGGGGGGGIGPTVDSITGSGGGSGGYIEALITTVAASYGYAVGAGGTGGIAGTNGFAGGDGAEGLIFVEEYYQ